MLLQGKFSEEGHCRPRRCRATPTQTARSGDFARISAEFAGLARTKNVVARAPNQPLFRASKPTAEMALGPPGAFWVRSPRSRHPRRQPAGCRRRESNPQAPGLEAGRSSGLRTSAGRRAEARRMPGTGIEPAGLRSLKPAAFPSLPTPAGVWGMEGSNLQPLGSEPNALPLSQCPSCREAGCGGLEPPPCRIEADCSST